MKQYHISFNFFFFSCLFAMVSCAQQKQPDQAVSTEYAGSTPCDAFIRAQMNIQPGSNCEFIKWELRLDDEEPGSFRLKAEYGESKPNTNGFKNAIQWIIKGKFTYTTGTSSSPKTRVLNLFAPELKSPLQLIALDSNIFHFADSNQHFLVGNGGWGYVLNRIKKP